METLHAASRVALGHLLMDDTAASRHPLDVASGDGAMVAHAIAMFYSSGEDIGDGLDAAMRVPGKSGEIILGDVIAKVVEEEERASI